MPRRQRKASELTGINIYQDPKHGTVLYDWITKRGYQLTSSDVKWYNISQSFILIGIICAYACFVLFKFDLVPSIIIGAIVYFIVRMIYQIKFLNNLPYIENYTRPDKGNIFTNAAKTYSKQRIIVLIVLAVALFGVTLAYLIGVNPQGSERIGIYILLVGSIILLGFAIITLIYKKNNH